MHKSKSLTEYNKPIMSISLEELESLNVQRKGAIRESKEANLERRKEIMKLHLVDNVSMSNIARRFNLSRQRVHQIINNYY